MLPKSLPLRLSVLLLVIAPSLGNSGQLNGNMTYTFERVAEKNSLNIADEVSRQTMLLSFEDALFTKNRLRLSMNIQRREFSQLNYTELRPIYEMEIRSFGYSINARYFPFKRQISTVGGTSVFDEYTRDWRAGAYLSYPDYPSVRFQYSKRSAFDREEIRRVDEYGRSITLETGYSVNGLSVRGSFNDFGQKNRLSRVPSASTKAYNGVVAFNRQLTGLGNFSANYNYYDTKRTVGTLSSQNTQTQSVGVTVSLRPIDKVSTLATYSGRFARSVGGAASPQADNQNISAGIGYTPVSFLSTQLTKSYQTSSANSSGAVASGGGDVEYVTAGVTLSRYLRRGVDTRFTASRTMFQKSRRQTTVFDSSGIATGVKPVGGYRIDTYNAALNFTLRQYIEVFVDATVSRDSKPADPVRRYQFTRSIDSRVYLSEKLEGRLHYTWKFQGAHLALNRSYSEGYNIDMTYTPGGGISLTGALTHSEVNGPAIISQNSLTLNASYSFRRKISLYASINSQENQQGSPIVGEIEQSVSVQKPRTNIIQLVWYAGAKTTVSLGYTEQRNNVLEGVQREIQTLQATLNLRL